VEPGAWIRADVDDIRALLLQFDGAREGSIRVQYLPPSENESA